MPKIMGFPNCCTAHIIYNLGGSELTTMRTSAYHETDLRKWIEEALADYGHKVVVAMTNDEQKLANGLLLEYGFNHSPWISKKQHAQSKIRVWWFAPIVE